MHPEDIKAAIRKRGSTQAAIARTEEVSQMAVSAVITGRSKSARIARRIALVTGLSVHTLWPGKYSDESVIGRRSTQRKAA